ncbi:MAG: AarF/ABC1/UbiB kinase family protein [Alphaproteobacteria bacterium]|nr:AarF/ABC1/UbiB kinase family protein [Alphaproteobacteria bacterium]
MDKRCDLANPITKEFYIISFPILWIRYIRICRMALKTWRLKKVFFPKKDSQRTAGQKCCIHTHHLFPVTDPLPSNPSVVPCLSSAQPTDPLPCFHHVADSSVEKSSNGSDQQMTNSQTCHKTPFENIFPHTLTAGLSDKKPALNKSKQEMSSPVMITEDEGQTATIKDILGVHHTVDSPSGLRIHNTMKMPALLPQRVTDGIVLTNAPPTKQTTPPLQGCANHHDSDQRSTRAKGIQEIIKALGTLKGPMVKIAQMAGMIPGLLPDDCAQALLTLCTNAPPMHGALLGRKMQLEWGKDWQTRFARFDQNPVASASLGQVHRAALHDGTEVAVKVQYPTMKQAVQADLALFKMILRHAWESSHGLDMRDFPHEWEQRLYEELDYGSEIRNISCWRELFKDNPLIHIPFPFPDLTTAHILTMSWSPAQGIETAFHQNQDLRHDLGQKIFWAWYYPFYRAGMLHGDPHMGNMAWSCPQPPTETGLDNKRFYEQNAQLHIFDFGCVRIFSPMFVQGFCHLYQGLLNKNSQLTQQAYAELGFKDLTHPMIMALNDWAHFLLAPFLQDQDCYLDHVSCPKQALDAMHHLENTLKDHGGTTIPPEFLIFDRVAVILGAVLIRLQVKANWHRLMHPLIESFCLTKCRTNQQRLLEECQKNDILYSMMD